MHILPRQSRCYIWRGSLVRGARDRKNQYPLGYVSEVARESERRRVLCETNFRCTENRPAWARVKNNHSVRREHDHYAIFAMRKSIKDRATLTKRHTYLPQELSWTKRRKPLVEALSLHFDSAEASEEFKENLLEWIIFYGGSSVRAWSFYQTNMKNRLVFIPKLMPFGSLLISSGSHRSCQYNFETNTIDGNQ